VVEECEGYGFSWILWGGEYDVTCSMKELEEILTLYRCSSLFAAHHSRSFSSSSTRSSVELRRFDGAQSSAPMFLSVSIHLSPCLYIIRTCQLRSLERGLLASAHIIDG
jgi:hypothetical protein